MIKKIRIKNFKCYGPRGADFNLSKINFIFGDNSAGKSTFLQFLKMVANQFDHVGTVSSKDIDKHLFKGAPDKVVALLRVSSGQGEGSSEDVWEFRFSKGNNEYELISQSNGRPISRQDFDAVLPIPPKGWEHVTHKEARRIEDEKKKSSGVVKFENIIDGIDSNSNDKPQNYLDDIFERLEIPYCCVSKNNEISEMEIRDLDFDIDVPLKDVGTGINGLVRLAFDLKEWQGGILELEEPETNVNEEHMAPLAKVLVEEALKRENGQLIVECHSKLMALQLAAMVREGILKCYGNRDNDDALLSVIEIVKHSDGSTAEQVYISPDGEIDWPHKGFFPAEGKLLQKMLGV